MKTLGEAAAGVVGRIGPRAGPVPNDPHQEFVLMCCEGVPPARQKLIIMTARRPEVGLIGDADAEILIDALGLRGT